MHSRCRQGRRSPLLQRYTISLPTDLWKAVEETHSRDLANIEKGSNDEVLPDVTFATLRSMILSSLLRHLQPSTSPTPRQQVLMVHLRTLFHSIRLPPNGGPVSFIQASEILDKSKSEPEGVSRPQCLQQELPRPTRDRREESALFWATRRPPRPKLMEQLHRQSKNPSTPLLSRASPMLNWAALAEEDDDDLGEAPVFEPLPSSTTSALWTPAPGTLPQPLSPASTSAPAAPSLHRTRLLVANRRSHPSPRKASRAAVPTRASTHVVVLAMQMANLQPQKHKHPSSAKGRRGRIHLAGEQANQVFAAEATTAAAARWKRR